MVRGIAWILLLCGLAVFAQPRVGVVPTVAQLGTTYPGQNAPYQLVLGYSEAGDWGSAKLFRWDETASGPTNAINLATRISVGRWVHDWDGDVRAFGAIGRHWDQIQTNPPVDVTSQLQASIDYAENKGYRVFIPAGVYGITSITVKQCEIYGVRTQVERPREANTILMQVPGASGHGVVITSDSLDKPNIHDLTLIGRGDVSTPGKKQIREVVDRYSFKVLDEDSPSVGNRTGYPIQWAMFYSSEGRWLGVGAVTNTSSSGGYTTIQMLGAPEDSFSTIGTNLTLTTSEQVVFAPVSIVGGTAWVDPARAGWCGIFVNPGTGPRIADVTVAKFHTGIYYDAGDANFTVYPILDGRVNIVHPEFAGLAARSWVGAVDSMISHVTVSGPYGQPSENLIPSWNSAETNTVKNAHLRRCAFGLFNILSNCKINYVLTDGCVWGSYSEATADSWVDTAWYDRCVRGGILARVGKSPDNGGTGNQYGALTIRHTAFGEGFGETYSFLTNSRPAIYVSGPVANPVVYYAADISANTLVIASNPGEPKFDSVFDLRGDTEPTVWVGRAVSLSGARSQYGTGSVWFAKGGGVHSSGFSFDTGLYRDSTLSVGLRASVTNSVFRFDGTYLSFQSPLDLTNRLRNGSGLIPNFRTSANTNDMSIWVDPSAYYIGRNGNANYESWSGSNGSPGIVGRAFGGSHQSPSSVGSGQILVQVAGSGYNGSASETSVRLLGKTLSSFASTNEQSGWEIEATGAGATSRTPILYFRVPAAAGDTALWLYDARSNAVFQVKSATNGAVSGVSGRVLYID